MGIIKYLAGVFLLVACISGCGPGDSAVIGHDQTAVPCPSGPPGEYEYRHHYVRDQIRVCSFEVEGVRYQIVWFNGKSTTFKIGD